MYVRLLGPVAVGSDESSLRPVAGQTGAAVLAQLSLQQGRSLSSEALIDAVWDEPPSSARNAVQVAVSRLRKDLGSTAVTSTRSGYRLDESVRVDWVEAETLITRARGAAERGDDDAVESMSRQAIALFNGDPLQGLTSTTADAARQRARGLQEAARLLRARALLRLGQPEAAVEAIRPSCESDPLSEPAHVALIEALDAAGRRAAALRTYDRLRRALDDELGVDPSAPAQALFARLLQADADSRHSVPSAAVEQPAQAAPLIREVLPGPGQPHRALGLAPSRATAFQKRALRDHIPSTGTVVLSGPSGHGKTQLAADVFHDSRHELRLWVPAGSQPSVIAAYADAADRVNRVDSSRPAVERARTFTSWLASADVSWLVVLDDIDDPADLRGWWPPAGRQNLVVGTTQRRNAELSGEGRLVLDVDHYTSTEAGAYLRERLATARREPGAESDLDKLAADLGYHPLALGMAAAVIIDEALSIEDYRRLLSSEPLTESLPEAVRADGYPRSLQAAWSLAVERADRRTAGAARPMLELLSVLDPAGVPERVVCATAVRAELDRWTSAHSDGSVRAAPASRSSAHSVLRALHTASLTTHVPALEPDAVRTHALTARMTRERTSPERLITAVRLAAQALAEVWPETTSSSSLIETLRRNAALVEQLDAELGHQALWPPSSDQLPRVSVLHARSLTEAEQFAAAVRYLSELSGLSAERLGRFHPETIMLRNEIAKARSLSGAAQIAIDDLRELSAELQRMLGDDHPVTLRTAATLAEIQIEAGAPGIVIDQLRALLPRLEQAVGTDHEETVSALEALANAYAEFGDFETALRLYDTGIERAARRFGSDHRRTLVLRSDRAYWLGHAGDPVGSVRAIEQIVPVMQRVLGPTDPNTLRARNNWAFFMSDHAAAYDEFARLLVERLELLGPDHSDTLSTRANLANRRGYLGDPGGAANEFTAIVADQMRALGPEHRFTLLCRGYLARWLVEAGDRELGLEKGKAAVADLERVLGAEHPYTRRIAGYLAELTDSSDSS